ncbi:MAG: AMP-binding protein, partial [Geminicoccaceae bacterium]|nr:AMP-binding protein [Geminicoccaceae bacterium]
MGAYDAIYRRSLEDPEGFWGEAAEDLEWERRWGRVLDDGDAPFYRWFAGGALNTCHNAVDRHVEAGHGDRAAILYDSPVTGTKRRITYAELQDRTAKLAGALRAEGVSYGDRVVVYMPMVPEALVAMLACARIGAVHSVVFGGFAANELAARIDDAKPRLILAASCGIEPGRTVAYKPLLDAAIGRAAHKVERTIVLQRPECRADMTAGRDLDWGEAVAAAEPAPCVPVEATDPLYILYTSGTTGAPKGVVRHNGGHAAALLWSMKAIYDVGPGDVFWCASDVGWVVG